MDVILLEKIENVGAIGDQVKVKPGFARNYLIPHGKATLATPENIAKFEARRADLVARAQAGLAAAQVRAAALDGQIVSLRANAGPEGKLFGSVGTIDIAGAIKALGIEIERSEVRLPEGPLRVVGEHAVELHLHSDVSVQIKVVIEADEAGAFVPLVEDTEDADAEE
jgi:large subunit ribosomal protein L9